MLKEKILCDVKCKIIKRRSRMINTEQGTAEVIYEMLHIASEEGVYVLRISIGYDHAAECISSNKDIANDIFDMIFDSIVTPCGLYDTLHNIKNQYSSLQNQKYMV